MLSYANKSSLSRSEAHKGKYAKKDYIIKTDMLKLPEFLKLKAKGRPRKT
jgi:hypothetical protein